MAHNVVKPARPASPEEPRGAPVGLALPALVAIVVGSMIGSGIFALPSQMASSAAPGPLLIGWTVTGVGMLMLAFVFQTLARRKPEVDGGVYGYARSGFREYVGFTSAWGYWVSAWVGNVAYLVLLMSTLGYWFRRGAYRRRAFELLELVGLGHRAKHKPRELSGGEMQRAAIARALLLKPKVLLADEPTGNLDRSTGEAVMQTLAELNDREKLTIVMVTHDPWIAGQADRTVKLVEGRGRALG